MSTDYDAPRAPAGAEPASDGGLRLDTRRSDAAAATLTMDDDDIGYASALDLLDLTGSEDSTIPVTAQRLDEFTCVRCFLIQHRSRRVSTAAGGPVCRDCY